MGKPTSVIAGDFLFLVRSGKVTTTDLDPGIRLCPGEFYRHGCNSLQCQVSMWCYSSSTYKSCCQGRSAALGPWEGRCLCLPASRTGDSARGVQPGRPHPCLSIRCTEGLLLGTDRGPGLNCLPPVRKTIALIMIFLMGVYTASKSGVILPAHFIQIIM